MFFRFFFFKHNTAYEVRISDWSSDVCSSDLSLVRHPPAHQPRPLRDLRSDPGHGELAPHLRRGLALRRRSAEHGARPARRGMGGRAGRRPAGKPAVIEVIALDGDDTLWHSEQLFVDTQEQFRKLVAPYIELDAETLDARLPQVERDNP